ncbi:MAG: dephospho-CoA kinase [Acidobacteriota bacterium]|nr:dephospho-CoA kinase [Acidobacteriota bacterium]
MLKVGLTGGMACGKSLVAECLRELGCHVIEADQLGHEVIAPGGDAYDAVIDAFGPDIVGEGKQIDRALLAAKVFGDPAELERLNAIVHPAVRARARQEFAAIEARDPHGVIVYVAAILIESGAYREVDKIIVVSCEREQQIERAMLRPGASRANTLARLERQMPLEKKKAFADYIVDAGGERADTLRQTEAICRELKSEALRRSS